MPSHGHDATITAVDGHTHTRNYRTGIGSGSMVTPATETTSGRNVINNAEIPNLNSAGNHTHTAVIFSTGGGTPHNNMQPYVVVNYWIRTA